MLTVGLFTHHVVTLRRRLATTARGGLFRNAKILLSPGISCLRFPYYTTGLRAPPQLSLVLIHRNQRNARKAKLLRTVFDATNTADISDAAAKTQGWKRCLFLRTLRPLRCMRCVECKLGFSICMTGWSFSANHRLRRVGSCLSYVHLVSDARLYDYKDHITPLLHQLQLIATNTDVITSLQLSG